jgi:hypothetical protein
MNVTEKLGSEIPICEITEMRFVENKTVWETKQPKPMPEREDREEKDQKNVLRAEVGAAGK